MTTAIASGKWNEIKHDFCGRMPAWVYHLEPGDELKRSNGEICIFERAMQKNIAFRDSKGKGWRGRPLNFVAWRKGCDDNLMSLLAIPPKFVTDESGARNLQIGDVALFILSDRRIYIAKITKQPNPSTVSASDLSGKGYRYPLDSFVMILPPDKFPG